MAKQLEGFFLRDRRYPGLQFQLSNPRYWALVLRQNGLPVNPKGLRERLNCSTPVIVSECGIMITSQFKDPYVQFDLVKLVYSR